MTDACGEASFIKGVSDGPYFCTREPGHDGPHRATMTPEGEVIREWPSKSDT